MGDNSDLSAALEKIFGPLGNLAPDKAGPMINAAPQNILNTLQHAPQQFMQNAAKSPIEMAIQALLQKLAGQQHQQQAGTPPMFPPIGQAQPGPKGI